MSEFRQLRFRGVDELAEWVGRHLGYSDWLQVDQARINMFADATGDHQWIHVDVERAASGQIGGPVAHGYLTLSLIPSLLAQMLPGEGRAAADQLRLRQGAVPGAGAGRVADQRRSRAAAA